jgi:SAM-dependent methyltransferase
MAAEFDAYARDYDLLLKDPIRDRFAGNSLFFHERKLRVLLDYLARRAQVPGKLRWLDIGCGRGELLRLGAAHFAEAAGCDLSADMLKYCSGLRVIPQREAALIPFGDRGFDVVSAACVYHHLGQGERMAMTREASRVLRPGGVFVIFEHNPWNPVTRAIVRRTPVDANAVLLSLPETKRLMRCAGLALSAARFYLFFPERLYRRCAGVESRLGFIPVGGQYAVFARQKK